MSFVRNVPREGLSEEELNEAAGHRDIEGTGSRWRTAGAQALRWKCARGARETPRRPVSAVRVDQGERRGGGLGVCIPIRISAAKTAT